MSTMSVCAASSLILKRLNYSNSLVHQINKLQNLSLRNKVQQNFKYATVSVTAAPMAVKKEQKVSKAMKAYLERAQEHDEFMKTQSVEYQIGKRHLANMMGEDPETFTQADVDHAIEYLFPSGLYDKKAKPMMKPPEEIFPARKAAEFDETGRPHHSMFYTGKPNFFKLLYDIVEEINKINDFEEKMHRKSIKADQNLKIDFTGYQWMPKEQLETNLVEKIADIEYGNFKQAMDRLVTLPFSYKCKDFIDKYRQPLMDQSKTAHIPKPKFDENGREYVTTYECLRKRARADVTIRFPGTGLLTINGKDITYFDDVQPREQVHNNNYNFKNAIELLTSSGYSSVYREIFLNNNAN